MKHILKYLEAKEHDVYRWKILYKNVYKIM